MNTTTEKATAGHTPGPWLDLFGNPWNDDEGNRLLITTPDKLRTIAHVFNAGDIDECEANARLIAAAPELLYALKMALDVMEVQNVGLGGTQSLVRRAIAKSTQPEGR